MSAFQASLDQAIPAALAEHHVPGCAIALIEQGRVIDMRVYGVADVASGAPVTPQTRFSLQSVSKSIAAWTAMTLVRDGRLDLDAPISRYLRRFTLTTVHDFDLDLVTPRRLLSHHAGVTEAGFRGVELDQTGFDLLDAMNGRLPPPNAEQRRHYEYWNLPEDDDLVRVTHPPGEKWRYSNAGFGLLQVAMEDITGQAFTTLVSDRVLAPLGMARAGFERFDDQGDAAPHGRDGSRAQHYRWLCAAAAGVYASIEDLAAFACAAMSGPDGQAPGRGVLTPALLAAMYASHGPADQSSGLPFEAGLGHIVTGSGANLNAHHSGGSIGWRSLFSTNPHQGAGFCILLNGEAANEVFVPLVRRWREERIPAAPSA